jgi:hypothetical protein
MSLLISLWFAVAAFWAMTGTNTQARLTRQQLLEDDDPLVRRAVGGWTPVRWLALPKTRAERRRLESQLRKDPERRARYTRLSQELGAWNALESSVALAFVAALWSAGAALFGG